MNSSSDLSEYVKQKMVKAAKERLESFVKNSILKSPAFWIVLGCLFLIILIFYFVATLVSSTTAAVSQNVISEKFLPPQIYASDLEELITSDFGKRKHPVTGEIESFHSGIDLGVPEGTPVQSSFDGIVESVSFPNSNDPARTQNAGIHVVLKSTDTELTLTSRYLHLSQVFVYTGQSVSKGTVIGLSGNTGRSTGAHLHYELIPDGESEATDPKPYLLTMSKLVDLASEQAFKAYKKINWSQSDFGLLDRQPKYYSKPMLYLSDLYFASPLTPFSTTGAGTIKDTSSGLIYNSFFGEYTGYEPPVEVEDPDEEKSVVIPVTVGSLTDSFFIQYAAAAQYEELRSGVLASITLAQAALESGRGKHAICNNMFGIKANKSYKGDFCYANTHEEVNGVRTPTKAKFRAYSNAMGSFADHSTFLLKNSRYRIALSKKNPYEFANELQRAGYATDSQYANKLKTIIRKQNLASLDMSGGIDPLTGQPFQDVLYAGGPSSGGDQSQKYITFTFGISQYYGNPASRYVQNYDSKGRPTSRNYYELKSALTGNPIINLEDYNHMLSSVYDSTTGPNLLVKDIPKAIQVTLYAPNNNEFYVDNVEYIKGMY